MHKLSDDRSISEVVDRIENADGGEISEIIRAIIRGYRKLFPDWEVIFLSMHRNDPVKREKDIENLLRYLQG